MTKLASALACILLLAGCDSTGTYAFGGPAPWVQRQQDLARQVRQQEIDIYGYPAFAECSGRGLNFTSNAFQYCLEAQQYRNR